MLNVVQFSQYTPTNLVFGKGISMDNIFCFEETEKFGLRKGIVFYFDDWIEQKTICVLEKIIEAFLLMAHAEFTKKRGTNDYPNRRNIRGGWRKVFHREFDDKDFTDTYYLQFDNCAPQHLQTIHTCIALSNSKEQRFIPAILRNIVCAILALWIMLVAPTGWLYDLWAGVGTEQGQRPGEGVRQLQQQEDVRSFFYAQTPATVTGGYVPAWESQLDA